MWFKNLQGFAFSEKVEISPEKLMQVVSDYAFSPINGVEQESKGWVSPHHEENMPLVHSANGFMLLCLRIEEKIVPAAVVREQLENKIAEIESREGRKVYKKEKESTHIYGYIDPIDGWLFIDAASSKKAELFTSELRRALGSLKITLPEVMDVPMILTEWVMKQQLPAEFAILDNFVIEEIKTGGLIRAQRQDIFSESMQSLLGQSREVVQLALSWVDKVSFVLKSDFSVKSVKFLQDVKAEASEVLTESNAQRFDADFVIMTDTLRHFWRALYGAFAKKVTKAEETQAIDALYADA
jgi:recombination associated protein RdgC